MPMDAILYRVVFAVFAVVRADVNWLVFFVRRSYVLSNGFHGWGCWVRAYVDWLVFFCKSLSCSGYRVSRLGMLSAGRCGLVDFFRMALAPFICMSSENV